MSNSYHYHDGGGKGLTALLVFLGILFIILLAIVAKLFIIAGIIAILIGIYGLYVGFNKNEGIIILYGIIYIVVGFSAIFFGNWLYGFLEDIGAIKFVTDIFNLFKTN